MKCRYKDTLIYRQKQENRDKRFSSYYATNLKYKMINKEMGYSSFIPKERLENLSLEDRVIIPDSTDPTKNQVVNYNAAGEILDDKGVKTGNKIVLSKPGQPVISDGKLTILDENNKIVTDHKYALAGVSSAIYSEQLTTLPFSKITKIF